MTKEDKTAAFRILNVIQAKKEALKSVQEKITELLSSNDGFMDPKIDLKIAWEIDKYLNKEIEVESELQEASREFREFMAKHKISFTSSL